MKVLEVKNLVKTYPSFKLDNVSFALEKGSIMGLIGRNGAGKTTTLKSILNLVHPESGDIKFFGLLYNEHENEIKAKIGYATSTNIFYPRKTIGEIASRIKRFYSGWDSDAYAKYISLFALDESKKLKDLSEGMKVKFSIALALSHKAEILILDEPTSGLDPVSRDEILSIFKYLKHSGTSILFSTHITSDLEKCADAITYIKKGKIIKSAKIDDFISSYPECASLEEIMIKEERNSAFDIEA